MAKTQDGYLGKQGPVMVDDSTVAGKYIILQGIVANGTVTYYAKQPAYAGNLAGFPYTASQCTLGPYSDNQVVVVSEAYKVPSTGDQFDSYQRVGSDWVAGSATPNTTPGAGTGGGGSSTGGGGSSTGGGGSSTGGGGSSTGGGGSSTPDTTFKAPTIGEQISTFLSNYWWLVVLLAAVLLWKPVIAPALGMDNKRKRR